MTEQAKPAEQTTQINEQAQKENNIAKALCESYFKLIKDLPQQEGLSEQAVIASFLMSIESVIVVENQKRSADESNAHIDAIIKFMEVARKRTIK